MNDINFFQKLKSLLLLLEQALISADLKSIEAFTKDIYLFMKEAQTNPPTNSDTDLSAIISEIQDIQNRNTVLIQEGLSTVNELMLDIVESKQSRTNNYQNPRLSGIPHSQPAKGIFDTRA